VSNLREQPPSVTCVVCCHFTGCTDSISAKNPSASVGWMYTAPFNSV